VKLQDLTAQLATELGLERPRGARVDWVQPATPAEQAGLKRGDVILRFNSVDIIDYNHLITMVSTTPIGQAVDLLLWRDHKSIETRISVADRELILAAQPPSPTRVGPGGFVRRPRPRDLTKEEGLMAGLQLAVVDSATAARKHGWADASRGVVIARVEPEAPLASILQPLDLIEAIDGNPVRTAEEVRSALLRPGEHAVSFQRKENGSVQSRIVQIESP
jgi:serine protease Do